MAWRVARALDTLLSQLNTMAPRRSKVSDGSIGDAAHASRDSDHNPWYIVGGVGVVTARDFTHDPAGGLDCHWLASRLVASRDNRIKYVIWNRQIWTPSAWRSYTGPNPHTSHLHLSVQPNASCDDTRPWNLGLESDPDMTPEQDKMLRALYEGVYAGGPSTPNGRPLATLIGETKNQVQSLWDGVYKGGPSTPGGRPLAALIGDAAASGGPSDEQVSAIITALADRLTEALGASLATELGRRLSQ